MTQRSLALLALLPLLAACGALRKPSASPRRAPAPRAPYGKPLGQFKLSFYVLTEEVAHKNEPYNTPVYSKDGTLIGRYPKKFVSDLRLQGSARLASGDVLAYGGRCRYGKGMCYRVLPRAEYPWGRGSTGQPLSPFRTIAVDPRVIPYGSRVYIPELDGLEIEGEIFDGCFVANDTGGAIKGRKIDVFAGRRAFIPPARSRFESLKATIYRGGERCAPSQPASGGAT